MLEDRIRMFEGRPQVDGARFRPGEHGEPVSYTIEDPAGVNDSPRTAGLNTLEERTEELRVQAVQEKIQPLPDCDKRQKEYKSKSQG